jgi:hypothetical protein
MRDHEARKEEKVKTGEEFSSITTILTDTTAISAFIKFLDFLGKINILAMCLIITI